jgi:hypothetical protein
MTSTSRPATWRAPVLAALGGLFFLRVIGQAVMTWRPVRWLPPVEHWQSGLLPYPVLLGAQAGILLAMGAMVRDAWRGRGRFALARPRLARRLEWLARLYFASMVARYAVTMSVRPQWRWFGHTIPIVFHMVLAAYLFVYAGVLKGEREDG